MPVSFDGIRMRRQRRKMTLTEAAKAAGWTPQKWANLEAGRRADPRVSTVETVARVLGCKVDDLLKVKR
jgi:transcriptional regulator with XRE-family HTH domain